MTTDQILLRGLRVVAICGLLPEERERPQPFEINAEIVVDLSAAGQSDDLNDTIDYGSLTDQIVELANESRFGLLEHFSQRIAELILTDPKALEVTIQIDKLRPPVGHDLASSAVRITRSR